MERKPHYLRPRGKSVYPPRHIIVIDTWGDQQAVTPRSAALKLGGGVAFMCEQRGTEYTRWSQLTFTTAQQFWDWLYSQCQENRRYWLFGWGISRTWALLGGWRLIDGGELALSPGRTFAGRKVGSVGLIDGDPPTFLNLKATAGFSLSVCDVRNYVDATVEQIAADADVQLCHSSVDALCLSTVQAMTRWLTELFHVWREHELGAWRPTLGGLAYSAWRTRFVDRAPLVHCHADTESMERRALFGGEFRAYKLGEVFGPVYMLDVNMLYPWAATAGLLPVEIAAPAHAGSLQSIYQWRERLICCADVRINSPNVVYPKRREDGGVSWCCGSFWTTLIGDELLAAIDAGHVVNVGTLSAYIPGRPLDSFVGFCVQQRRLMRSLNLITRAKIFKSLANGLIGKFGQRAGRWRWCEHAGGAPTWGQWTEVDADSHEVKTFRAVAGEVQEQTSGGESIDSVPSLTAAVHARARQRMQMLRRQAGPRNVYYQASDTLHVNQQGRDNLLAYLELTQGELGALREVAVCNYVDYRGPNDFTADGKVTVAGLPAGAFESIPGVWTWHEVEGIREVLAHGPRGDVVVTHTRSWSRSRAELDLYDDEGWLIEERL